MDATMTQEAEQPGTRTATDDVIPRIPPANSVLKRHPKPLHPHRLGGGTKDCRDREVAYKECMKNHAASFGGHAIDGCREFMPSPAATLADPKSLKCDACGCHRNFHRHCRLDETPLPALPPPPQPTSPNPAPLIDFQPLNRHQPSLPPPPVAVVPLAAAAPSQSPGSPSPPPISSTYYYPVMKLTTGPDIAFNQRTGQQKRFRTKFSLVQKEKMLEFAEKVGWRMQRSDLTIVRDFCDGIGVNRNVFKVWMHNNKNTLRKRSGTMSPNGVSGDFANDGDNGNSRDNAVGGDFANDGDNGNSRDNAVGGGNDMGGGRFRTNGSSSSS